MVAESASEAIQQFRIEKAIYIDAPIDIAFEVTLEELGPDNELPDGTPMPLVLEPWPGGRWFRDLGNNSGHFWGNVQVIKPPKLLEICGPLFMSYPCANHIQYRLEVEGVGTKLTFLHRGFAEIPEDHRNRIGIGWNHILERIKATAEKRKQP